LTEQDQALCRCLKRETSYGGWGRYADIDYFFETDRAAAQLVGHPLVFRENDRSQPIEIVRRDPQLVVAKKADGKIHMALQPRPGPNAVQLTEEGPNRLGVVSFTPQHVKLDEILDGGLTIPASGQQQVVETVQAVAKMCMRKSRDKRKWRAAICTRSGVGPVKSSPPVRRWRSGRPTCRRQIMMKSGVWRYTISRDLAFPLPVRRWS
jgi:hypothetical protein